MPTLDPPETITTSASACSAVGNRRGLVAARGPGSRPLRRRARPAPPASARWRRQSGIPAGRDPAGSSSLPVTTSRTRGRRTTSTSPMPDRAEDAHVLRPQHAPALEHRRAARRCLRRAGRRACRATPASSALMRRGPRRPRPPTHSAGSTASAPARHRRARHHAHRLARATRCRRTARPGIESPITVSGSAAVGAGAVGARGHHRVAVHRRAVEARHVHVAHDRRRQHAARGRRQRPRARTRAAAAARRATRAPPPPCAGARTRACGRRGSAVSQSRALRPTVLAQGSWLRLKGLYDGRTPPGAANDKRTLRSVRILQALSPEP